MITYEGVIDMKNNSFTGGLMYEDGVIDKTCSGMGYVYGLHYGKLDDIFEAAISCFEEEGLVENFEPIVNGYVRFTATNVSWDEGQMSFPEAGQWDFPPHWEMDITIDNVDMFPEDVGN